MPALPVVLGHCGDWMFSSQLPTLSSPSSQMSQRGNRRIPQPETTLTPTLRSGLHFLDTGMMVAMCFE